MKLHKKALLSTATYLALALCGGTAFGQSGTQPKISIITQWTSGSNGAALNAMGDLFKAAGGEWQDNSVAGFTTDMMNKLRADIIAGNPPAASQLKGPEIKAWSAIGKTVNLDAIVASTDFESVTPKDLAALHRPKGDWISLPLQIYRINTLYLSKKAMDKIGATSPPTTWDEFNAMAEKMKAAGITPITYGGLKWTDTMTFEIVLLGISPDAYRKAIMGLDNATLRGPEVLAAFRQLRKMTDWIDPASAGTHWSTFIPQFMSGQQGMLLMGNWATGNFAQAKFVEGKDYLCARSPTNDGKPIFDINADGLIFWDKDDPGYKAG